MTRLNVSEARASLTELLDRVADGEEITITRYGRPAAVLLRPDAVRARRAEQTIARARQIGALVAAAREQPCPRRRCRCSGSRNWSKASVPDATVPDRPRAWMLSTRTS
jgi:prevent-host-death family protein